METAQICMSCQAVKENRIHTLFSYKEQKPVFCDQMDRTGDDFVNEEYWTQRSSTAGSHSYEV